MGPKKKKKHSEKTPEAQQLIDALLDERTPAPRVERDVTESVHVVRDNDATPIAKESDDIVMNSTPHFDRTRMTKPQAPGSGGAKSTMASGPHTFDQVTATGAGSVPLEIEGRGTKDDKTVRLAPKLRPETSPQTNSRSDAGTLGATSDFSQPSSSTNEETSVHGSERSGTIDRLGITELKTVVKMRDRSERGPQKTPSQANHGFTSPEAALKQSENLRIAQSRITELEQELERLRRDNEQLASAGETLRRRSDELLSKAESLDIQLKEIERTHSEEKKVFRGQLQAKDRENHDMRGRLEEMENRLESNFKKIRVRERELEHRLEIVRMESQTLVATKDKMLLDLKRQIDQITLENDYAKQKSQELFSQYKDKQETIRRVVRALRIALTILEGDEDAAPVKKAE